MTIPLPASKFPDMSAAGIIKELPTRKMNRRHFFHRAGKGTRLAAQRLEDVNGVPRRFDATTHLGRYDQPSWADMADQPGRQGGDKP